MYLVSLAQHSAWLGAAERPEKPSYSKRTARPQPRYMPACGAENGASKPRAPGHTAAPGDESAARDGWHPPGGHPALRLRSRQEFADAWDDLRAVKLDIGHEGLMREASHAVFQVEAGRSKSGEICRDLLRDGCWRPDVERSLWPDLIEEGLLRRDSESAGLADAADDLQVARPELFAGLLVSDGDMARRVHADR